MCHKHPPTNTPPLKKRKKKSDETMKIILFLSNFFFQKFFSDRRKIENFFIEEKFEIFFLSVIVKSEPFFFPAQKIPTSFSFPVYARTFCHDSSFRCDRIKESLNYCVYRIGTKKLSVSQRS